MTTVRNVKNNALPDIDELFQDRLVMSMTKSDVDARVLEYFHLCNAIVKNNGLAVLFSKEDGAKKKSKTLLNCLPEGLKTRLKNEIDFRLPTAKSNVSVLFKVICEKALEIDREDLALSRNKRRSRTFEANQEMTSPPLKRARIMKENDKSRQLQSQTTQPPTRLVQDQKVGARPVVVDTAKRILLKNLMAPTIRQHERKNKGNTAKLK
ncbi:Hypothetical protein PHPALM_3155 [Phytophthora palmivora]|uniref:Uncharacterized protein n=1 Tax=Phytophthora palmivora TaxID=4796 RepID=A0A2P4YN50_9STRA|nr:Hypothetical protein PHPALM_3155 [Phytophthora palmivora]